MPAGEHLRRRTVPCRYRDVLDGAAAPTCRRTTPPLHVPWASLHASLATAFGPADAVEPVYVRDPDAERWRGVSFSLRRLELARPRRDRAIERASYPTPWSRSMFASELAKQSSRSIAAVTAGRRARRLPRALALRRCLARDERRRRARAPAARDRLGDAAAACSSDTRDDAERGYTLEVRVSNLAAISLYEQLRLRVARRPTWLLH